MSRTYRNYFNGGGNLNTEPEKRPRRRRKIHRRKHRQELRQLAAAGDPDAYAFFGEE